MRAGQVKGRRTPVAGVAASATAPAGEPVGRGERLLVLAVALLLLCAAAAPIVSGYLHARPGERFLGLAPAYYEDYQSYFAWMRQAEQGHVLFRDLFTSEPHRRLIFLPVFWVMGTAARATGAPLVAIWWIAHAIATVLLVLAIHAFAVRFCGDRATRLLALALAAFASGFGWLVPAPALAGVPEFQQPIDLWMVEANQFFPVASSYFTLPLALALMLLALLRLLRYLDEGRMRDAGAAGGIALAVAMTHQYDVITLLAVAASWGAVMRRDRWRGLALFAAIPAPLIAYSLVAVKLDPVLSKLTWTMLVPGVTAHALGWGVPLLLASGAVLLPAVRRGHRDTHLLVLWLVAVAVLLLVPIEFRRKLIWGAHVPMALLAAMTARWGWRKIAGVATPARRHRALAWATGVALVVVCAGGSLRLERDLLRRAVERSTDEFVPRDFVEALDWLRQRARPGDTVIASPSLAPLVPGWTGATVFCGHWAQTIELEAKSRFVEKLFRAPGFAPPAQLRQVLERNRVRFLAVDARSMRADRLPDALPDGNIAVLARLVLHNPMVVIWEVEPPPVVSEEAPWRTGNWLRP